MLDVNFLPKLTVMCIGSGVFTSFITISKSMDNWLVKFTLLFLGGSFFTLCLNIKF